jgi:dynein heavy chain
MWLAGLHAPETYLAALVQVACRDRGWPLDRSTLYTQVTPYTDAAQVQQKPRCAAHRALTVMAQHVAPCAHS